MKKSPLPTILLSILALSAIGSLVLCWFLINASREIRPLQIEVNNINVRNATLDALVHEVIEYSSRNSQVDPILESIGAKRNITSTNKPVGK